jgi:hypothetical protein
MFGPLARGVGLAVLLPAVCAAQQIRGVVVENSSDRPVAKVTIELLSADTVVHSTTVSNGIGWFELTLPSGGQFLVRASHEAYRNSGALTITVGAQEIVTVVLRLSGGPIPLEPLIVKARARDLAGGFRERARQAAFGRFLTRADIDKYGGYSLTHIMRFTPEVRIEKTRDGIFVGEGVFMRTFGDLCVPAVYLDGVSVPTGRAFDINSLISLEAVEGIEVYRNSASAPMELRLPAFGEDVFCGVIAIWSRPTPGTPLTPKRALFASLLVGASLLLTEVLR